MDGKGATCVFLHSRDTQPIPCHSTVWVSAGVAQCTMIDCIDRLAWEGGKKLEGGAWNVYPYMGYETTTTTLPCTSSDW